MAVLHRGHPVVALTLAISGLLALESIALSWMNA
jgi:hypothetical protein